MTLRTALIVLVAGFLTVPAVDASAQSSRTLYTRAMEREKVLRDSREPSLQQLRNAVAAYEAIVRRFPAGGYADNALWQAGNLSLLAYDKFGQPADLKAALRMLKQLSSQYPSSSLSKDARELVSEHEAEADAPSPAVLPVPPPPVLTSQPLKADVPPEPRTTSRTAAVSIRDIKRTALPDGIRITIEMDAEPSFRAEQLENPRRVFFDIRNAKATGSLVDASLKFTDDIVRQIRFGRHPNATRIVMDMEGAESYSLFTLYDPFRLVVDFKRGATAPPAPVVSPPALPPAIRTPAAQPGDLPILPDGRALAARAAGVPSPGTPSANRDGKFSLARQLGLGISRIVIDAGHGGHDPGATSNGVSESELTLDVALRLSKLLEKQPGVEVVLTRSSDVFIPLEERTAIANREGADLFLSIHANASRNTRARGVETYFLNFATNPDAEAVAARENAGSAQLMHNLPAIVKAIALNNKLDESRDFAAMVQRSMVRGLSSRNRQLRDLGVKQAPFVVLIGASMPSVLSEIAFLSNKHEGTLLKTGAYRQQVAESLYDAVLKYQQSLKKARTSPMAEPTAK
jgi:N-acetylmuramoyl-L-alanine amidase